MQARRTRARIIAAAAQRFLVRGYAGTTMRAVALDAGVALPTVELAFRTKARLLKAVVDVAIAGDDDQVAMLDRQWAKRAERAAGLAATALEAARSGEDIAAVAAQLMSQREVMASWLVDGIMHRSALRDGRHAPRPACKP